MRRDSGLIVRIKGLGKVEKRREAMRALVGIRSNRHEFRDVALYVRKLRRDTRLDGMNLQ
jgi:hypothetical protein